MKAERIDDFNLAADYGRVVAHRRLDRPEYEDGGIQDPSGQRARVGCLDCLIKMKFSEILHPCQTGEGKAKTFWVSPADVHSALAGSGCRACRVWHSRQTRLILLWFTHLIKSPSSPAQLSSSRRRRSMELRVQAVASSVSSSRSMTCSRELACLRKLTNRSSLRCLEMFSNARR